MYSLLDSVSDFFSNIYWTIEEALPSNTSDLCALAIVSAVVVSIGSLAIWG
jgi:ABC-type uncharacterized transport system permease subunit